ncbi:MAG: short-chain dehydrogenase [Candidatus Marinimicrobia bacterium]|nr:short-chain dehydrogenase [Candidatus Neomarinimicrobiota bacterium]|tara:strand:+ start:20921 stop:21670 length:750 start_codon:yes stop_codon:yes gene_type:complete
MKTVIITGGTRGIGAGIAKTFLAAGYKVVIGSRNMEGLAKEENPNLVYFKMDVRNETDHEDLIQKSLENKGSLECYINCAGFSKWSPIDQVDDFLLRDMIEINLIGTFWGCKVASKHLKQGGSIINISSLAGKRGSANNSVYCATKFAVNGITQSLAKELGSKGIRVNAICPVYIDTNGLIEALEETKFSPSKGRSTANYLSEFTQTETALKRLPSDSDVADCCIFLASNSAKSITGQCINIDCGVLPQ